MAQIVSKLTDSERWRLFFLRHSYRGGRDYVYPPPGTADPRYGARTRPLIYIDPEGIQRIRNTDVGGGCYLFPHDREEADDFIIRLAQSYCLNLCAPVVSRYVSTVYRQEPKREVSPEQEILLADFDRRGCDVSSFMRDVATWALVYGTRLFVATDTPARDAGADDVSEATARERGIAPYSYVVRPTNVLDWAVDDDDTLVGIAVDEGPVPAEFSPFTEPPKDPPTRVRVWTPNEWRLYHQHAGKEAMLVESGPGFGFVPFVPVVFRPVPDGAAFEGRSLIEDVADIQLEIYNELSLLQDLHRHQGSQVLAIPKTLGGGVVGAAEEIALSTKHYLEVTGGMPQYIGPGVDHAREKREHVAWLVTRAMEAVGLIKRGRDSAQAASGESLRWEHIEFHDLASQVADMMEETERRVLAQREAIRTRSDYESVYKEIEVTYNRDFEPLDPLAESESLAAELTLGLGPEVELAMRKAYVQRRLGHLGASALHELQDGLESSAEAARMQRDAAALTAAQEATRPPPLQLRAPKSAGAMGPMKMTPMPDMPGMRRAMGDRS